MPRANNAGNLKPNRDRTAEELKRMGAKGGKASAQTRARKKQTRILIRDLLALTPKASRKTLNALQKLGYDVEKEGLPSVELLIQMQIANQAMSGDLAAARFLYDYAQVPDLKATLDRERVKAQLEAKRPAEGRDDPLAELLARIDADAANAFPSGEGGPRSGPDEVLAAAADDPSEDAP